MGRDSIPGVVLGLSLLVGWPAVGRADLIAHYAFDGDANDASGNAHHGTTFGATSSADRFGHADSAFSFDGVNDYVDVEQLLFNGADATIAFWAQSAGSQNTYSAMVSQGHWGADPTADTGFAFQYGYPSSNGTVLIWGDGGGGAHSWSTLGFGVDLETDTDWHHFAATKAGSTIRIYKDGALMGTSSAGMAFSTYRFNIGRDYFNADNSHRSFYGSIDDVYVFSHALSQAELEALSTVPEASSWLLVMLGLVVLLRRLR